LAKFFKKGFYKRYKFKKKWCIISGMETTENKIADITKYIKPSKTADIKPAAKNQTNPIFKKQLIISVKNNVHRFSVNDLFD